MQKCYGGSWRPPICKKISQKGESCREGFKKVILITVEVGWFKRCKYAPEVCSAADMVHIAVDTVQGVAVMACGAASLTACSSLWTIFESVFNFSRGKKLFIFKKC